MAAINLIKANEYISRSKNTVNAKYRPRYHLTPPVGWMNDPNGLVYFGGEYRVYYQFNPYATAPGIMYWGYCSSKDLITFGDSRAALAPEGEGASVFSGGALEYGGSICAMYTLHTECGGVQTEEIYRAHSRDGENFSAPVRAFDNENLPANLSRVDFRDPFPVNTEYGYFVFVGGKETESGKGIIIVLGGSPEKPEYRFTIGPFYELGDMCECPSYRRIDGKDVILVSGTNVPSCGNSFKNKNSSVVIVGEVDFINGGMRVESIKELDKGDGFYAPQFINGAKEPIMVGWLETWGKKYPTHELGHGWAGAFSVPRKISLKCGEVYQTPVESLENYYTDAAGKVPKCANIVLEFSGGGEAEISGENGKVIIGCRDGIYLDTTFANNMNGCIRRTDGEYKTCRVSVLLDVSCIEVFVDGGREVISSRIYIDGEYKLKRSGNVSLCAIKQIGSKQ